MVRGHLAFNVALAATLTVMLLAMESAPSVMRWILLGMVAFNGGLLLALWRRPGLLRSVATLDMAALMAGLMALDMLSPEPLTSVRAAFGLIPLFGTFVIGRSSAWGFWGVGSAGLLILTTHHGLGTNVIIDCVAMIGVSLLVTMLSVVAEGARLRSEALADTRLAALETKAEEALAASEAKSTFLATMSHEIRTPMSGVLGLTRLLLETEQTSEQRELSLTVLESGQSLMTVLNDVLDLSRLEAGRMTFEAVPLAPRRLAREVSDLMGPVAAERENRLVFQVDEDTPEWVEGDPTRLRQVLMNLVGNALKFTESGRVEVRLLHRESILRLEVEDSGIGIPESKLASLFGAFMQADSSTTRRFGGSGLGLAICRQLCERMGGAIGVRSKPGVGSTFWFELPCPACEPPEAAEVLDAAALPPGLRVLVAEDHPVNQLVVERELSAMGCEVVVVADGQQAVERVRQEDWDVVLMDCYMPVMDGFDATRAIRALGDRGALPILALTASATTRDQARVVAAGMDALLAKPVDPARLRAALIQWSASDRAAA